MMLRAIGSYVRRSGATALLFWALFPLTALAQSADPAYLGMISLLTEDGVPQQLSLSPEQQQQILQLIAQREAAALELAMESKALEAAERQSRQAAFVAESEQAGLAILNDEQQGKLQKLSLKRDGLASLANDELATQLGLTDEQRGQVTKLLGQRASQLASADERRQRILSAWFDRELGKVLTEAQQAQWQQMTTIGEASGIAGGATPAAGQPSVAPTAAPGGTVLGIPADADGKLRFNFRYAPWKDVLDWFATQAELSLLVDAPPSGTFNYTDPRSYELSEAIDLLNSVLLTKGYTLVRRDRMLIVINLEDGIPPNLVTTVPVQELDERGEFELVGTLFQLGKVTPEDAQTEITKLLGPQGSMQVLGKAKQIYVVETAGRLRTIRSVLQAMADPTGVGAGQVTTITLQNVMPEEAFTVIRQMLGLPEDQNAAPDGSLRMATDVSGQRLMVTGAPDKVQQVGEILKLIDVPMPGMVGTGGIGGNGPGFVGSPQLEVYPVSGPDSDSVLKVLQTLLAEEDVRLAIDPKTGSLIALGLPSHHATIRATLQQMQEGLQLVEVIPLYRVDPQIALLSVNRLFGIGEEGTTNAPKVDADVTNSRLLVRGTSAQIRQIESLLEKMGETGELASLQQESARNVRVLPMTSAEAQSAIDQIQQIWPTLRRNQIRTVAPSAVIRSVYPQGSEPSRRPPPTAQPPVRGRGVGAAGQTPARQSQEPIDDEVRAEPQDSATPAQPRATDVGAVPSAASSASDSAANAPAGESVPAGESEIVSRAISLRGRRDVETLLAQISPAESLGLGLDAERSPSDRDPNTVDGQEATEEPRQGENSQDDNSGADIIVAPGPNGLVIASQDLQALNDFEELLLAITGGDQSSVRDFAVFYLRHSTAEAASQIVNQILGGSSGDSDGGGGGLLGGLAGAALGDMGGGLVGSLLGGGGGGGFTPTGSFSIVPEPRLNMLVVQANATDMQMIERLLEIVDQRGSPETVETVPPPRMIPVYYTSAESVAGVVREVFAAQLASGPGQQRQPSPEDFIRALRGGGRGGRGGGGGGGDSGDDGRKLTVGIDSRLNQLVVSAPDDLFVQVEQLVRQLDVEDSDSLEMTRVVTLGKANPEVVRRALASIIGQAPAAAANSAQPGQNQNARGGGGDGGGRPGGERGGDNGDARRQQFEMFRAMREAGGGGGGGGGERGGGQGGRGGFGGRGGGGGGFQGGGFQGRGQQGGGNNNRGRGGR
jgi:type II secretory pathway component GspD/PulD (secretin)